jgi:hypothetical protein
MDPAVALAQAYLQLNGYLTVTEFPITSGAGAEARAVTDIDLIALRFPGALALGQPTDGHPDTDPLLQIGEDTMDLLICEVKEGKARLNPNLTRSDTLARTLERIGCCPPGHVRHHVESLQRHGIAKMDHRGVACRARIAVFAGRPGNPPQALVVSLGHAAREVCRFLQIHEAALHGTQFSQPALAQLGLLTKLGLFRDP